MWLWLRPWRPSHSVPCVLEAGAPLVQLGVVVQEAQQIPVLGLDGLQGLLQLWLCCCLRLRAWRPSFLVGGHSPRSRSPVPSQAPRSPARRSGSRARCWARAGSYSRCPLPCWVPRSPARRPGSRARRWVSPGSCSAHRSRCSLLVVEPLRSVLSSPFLQVGLCLLRWFPGRVEPHQRLGGSPVPFTNW